MLLLEAVLLGIVQGLTEFLPVSSSAHLILARAFFGWEADQFGLPFDVACHVGTLLAILLFFRADVLTMLQAVPRMFSPGPADEPVRITAVEVSAERMPREIFYIPAALLFLVVYLVQRRRGGTLSGNPRPATA